MFFLLLLLVLGSFGGAVYFLTRDPSEDAFQRLLKLSTNEETLKARSVVTDIDWTNGNSALRHINDQLGKAGFFTEAERRQARSGQIFLLIACTILGFSVGVYLGTSSSVLFGAVVGLYLGTLSWLLFIKSRAKEFQREVMFQLPLVLESLILLVESGSGILPAIEQVIATRDGVRKQNPVIRFFRLVYELSSHGMPFSQALEVVADACEMKVLRHVLLHLEISGTEGGELVPSLRALSDYTHTEWKLSVEARVKRLENLVVFPVFASVLGLMLLTVAVPIVPVLQFREMLNEGKNGELPLGKQDATITTFGAVK